MENNSPEEEINLDLSLGLPPEKKDEALVEGHVPQMQLLTSVSVPPQNINPPLPLPRGGRQPKGHQARQKSKKAVDVEDKKIEPPYAWATNKEAEIHNIRYLYSNNIRYISGQVACRPCEKNQTLEYNLHEKFQELARYIKENKVDLRNRAPEMWLKPKLISCSSCKSEMKPVISDNKVKINWLFLLLGEMLGCCTLEQLKYFCEKIEKHQTGAKDRVLYATYLGLCNQLDPWDNTFKL